MLAASSKATRLILLEVACYSIEQLADGSCEAKVNESTGGTVPLFRRGATGICLNIICILP